MADLLFVGQFIASKAGKTGLTVTVDVDRYTLADGSRTALVTAGSATEGRRGLYHYRLASADLATYQYVATFITADATVDQQEIAALGIVVPDALVGSRLAPAVAGRTLDVDASGNAAANVTHHAGVAVAAADADGNVPVDVKLWKGSEPSDLQFGLVMASVLDKRTSGFAGVSGVAEAMFFDGWLSPGFIGQSTIPIDQGVSYDNQYAGWTFVIEDGNSSIQFASAVIASSAANDTVTLLNPIPDPGFVVEDNIAYMLLPFTSLLPQATRDAMMLAPTAGDPAAGSIDAQLGALALEATAQAVLLDTGTTLPALIGGLSGATVTVVSSVAGGTVTVYAADTWRFTVLSDQLALADYETLGLIVKRSARQADSQALLYLRTDTGLVRMDGAAPVSAGNGTLTKTATSFTAVVHVAETQGLVPGVYTWWLKGLDTTPAPDEAVTLATGEFVVLAAGLQAVG